MNDNNLKNIIKEIKLGEIDGVKFLESLPNDMVMTSDKYLELLVRTIFIIKVKQRMQFVCFQTGLKIISFSMISIIFIKYLLF